MSRSSEVPVLSASEARRLLLAGQRLLEDPARPVGPRSLLREIEALGYVQIDTIPVVERAHHHVLRTRFDRYRPEQLSRLLERDRSLFEHWTHDASILPTRYLPHWRFRFRGFPESRGSKRWLTRMGPDADRVLRRVVRELRRDGPKRSQDFAPKGEAESHAWFGNLSPEKAALRWLWHAGRILVTRREGMTKVYDLAERVLPELKRTRPSSAAAYRRFAVREAFLRLGVATPEEAAGFFDRVSAAEARAECERAAKARELVRVEVAPEEGAPYRAYAVADFEARLAKASQATERVRLLSPFDPLLRIRDRTRRLFGFDFRLECFVPKPKRAYGYFVLPVLAGERLVARTEPRFDRESGTLRVEQLWWEPGVDPRRMRAPFEAGVEHLAAQLGARSVDHCTAAARHPAR